MCVNYLSISLQVILIYYARLFAVFPFPTKPEVGFLVPPPGACPFFLLKELLVYIVRVFM